MWFGYGRCRGLKYLHFSLLIVITWAIIACSNEMELNRERVTESPTKTNALIIWWEKGFELTEDEALQAIVNRWQEQTGNKVKLSFYTTSELSEKIARAVKAGNPPDLVMNSSAERILYPRLAWEGKLEDVSALIEPVKELYSENILKAITYHNRVTGKRSYYGVPVYQSTILIFYWQKLLAPIGLSEIDLPQDWDGFWQFWQQAQSKLKTQHDRNVYGLGFPYSGAEGADDTYLLFEQILEAYNVSLLNSQGKLLVNRPEVRQGIIKCLDWYTQFYQQGYVPPDAINWLNSENNRNLLNQMVLMTPNNTLSIASAVRQDSETYYNQLGISEFPNKPNGEPMRYLTPIRQAVMPTNSVHKQQAKDFLQYLIQPQIMTEYLKASGSRNLPVQSSVWLDSFWQQTSDPYLALATKVLTEGQTRLFYVVDHPAYSQVLKENIWGKTLNRIIVNKISPEQAADEAIARIEEIFKQW
ncbi:carbohydrate ABC transporter substrate-binding protein [Pleurocapsales cyanobacterium LEGE 06147]|nr:carbohydrate ABC transporter substrate-binding protein [Pleurocapsales cyanobacterium LEGE 06147]